MKLAERIRVAVGVFRDTGRADGPVFMGDGKVQGDMDELGRRLRAVFIALGTHHGSLEETASHYDRIMEEVFPAESVSHLCEGSWGWWAKKICCDPVPKGNDP